MNELLEDILNKHLNKIDEKLKEDLLIWYNIPVDAKKEEEYRANRLIFKITREFKVNPKKKCRELPYLAARYAFYDGMFSLYPDISYQRIINYTHLKSHCTVIHAEKEKESFFNAYPQFKIPYNRIAEEYNFKTI